MSIEIFGWLGSFLLAICAAPQAFYALKHKNSHGISWGFLLLWLFGEIFTLIYVLKLQDAPLLLNYTLNLVFLCVILYFKVFPKSKN